MIWCLKSYHWRTAVPTISWVGQLIIGGLKHIPSALLLFSTHLRQCSFLLVLCLFFYLFSITLDYHHRQSTKFIQRINYSYFLVLTTTLQFTYSLLCMAWSLSGNFSLFNPWANTLSKTCFLILTSQLHCAHHSLVRKKDLKNFCQNGSLMSWLEVIDHSSVIKGQCIALH